MFDEFFSSVYFFNQLIRNGNSESLQLLDAGEPEALGGHAEGDAGVAVLIQPVVSDNPGLFELPGDVIKLRERFKQLDANKNFDV